MIRHGRRGFSLVELAIVLGVVGVLIGSIWMFASQAALNSERTETALEINTVVTNIRSFYAGQLGMPNSGYIALVPTLINLNDIPAAMVRTTNCSNNNSLCADDSWGPASGGAIDQYGTFRVCNWPQGFLGVAGGETCPSSASAGTTQFFGIMLTGLSFQTCNMIIDRVTGAAGPMGLVEVNINNTNLLANGNAIQPVPDTVSNTYCPPTGTNNSTVTFIYRLTLPG